MNRIAYLVVFLVYAGASMAAANTVTFTEVPKAVCNGTAEITGKLTVTGTDTNCSDGLKITVVLKQCSVASSVYNEIEGTVTQVTNSGTLNTEYSFSISLANAKPGDIKIEAFITKNNSDCGGGTTSFDIIDVVVDKVKIAHVTREVAKKVNIFTTEVSGNGSVIPLPQDEQLSLTASYANPTLQRQGGSDPIRVDVKGNEKDECVKGKWDMDKKVFVFEGDGHGGTATLHATYKHDGKECSGSGSQVAHQR